MKKFLATILCFVYVVASSGATINFHYCMGKFIGADVLATAPKTCSNCGMHKDNRKGCCNDEQATIQLKKDQLTAVVNDIPTNHFVLIQHQYSIVLQLFSVIQNDVAQLINGPPLLQTIPAFIINCVFRI